MAKVEGNVLMEGVTIIFRNFAGQEGRYNREGDRNFAVLLDPESPDTQKLIEDGWNVKFLKPREDEEGEDAEENEDQPYLPVSVGYGKGRPPTVAIITESRGRTNIGEDGVEMLDWADITNVDLIVRPYNYDVNGKIGVKAYLKSLFVTIEEDELEKKYSNLDAQ